MLASARTAYLFHLHVRQEVHSLGRLENNSILTAYEESLAIRRDLAKDKSNAWAQRDLSFSLEKIGDIKLRAGDAAGALAAYEESL